MKQFFLLLVLVLSSNVFGQVEFSAKPIKFNPLKVKPKKEVVPQTKVSKFDVPKIVAPNIFKETNIFGTKPKENKDFTIGVPEPNFSLIPKVIFTHKLGDVYQDKMQKDLDNTLHENDVSLVREDKYFGEFKTKSKFYIVKYRDFIAVDGDLVRVYQNDKVIMNAIAMDSFYNEFKINLVEGINKIEFVAMNTGTSGGNTAEFQIYDDQGNLFNSYYWDNLATGFKGKLIIIKE
ncbi:hypothetical protein [Flavobacterium sp.]|uniref:hypothetical protein n=1 Tax=Flavobacterium sp. TaxID=239 RepID=UPI0038FCC838